MKLKSIEGYESCLSDESRLRGWAEGILFPTDTQTLCEALKTCPGPITVQGARTGLCGGAVPEGGTIVSLTSMDRILNFEENRVTVQAGVSLQQIAVHAAKRGLFFPPNPTEVTATIGGAFAVGAKGPGSLKFGGTSGHVSGVLWITPEGEAVPLRRGETLIEGVDIIDLLSGTEARFGVAAELTLELRPLPKELWGLVFFFQNNGRVLDFAKKLKAIAAGKDGGSLRAAEYFSPEALKLLESDKMVRLPPFPAAGGGAVYVELEAENEDSAQPVLARLLDLFSALGGGDKDTWAESGAENVEKLLGMRHAVTELWNGLSAEGGLRPRRETDFSAPRMELQEYFGLHRRSLEKCGVRGIIYGHLLTNHLHLALRPETAAQEEACQSAVSEMEKAVLAAGGCLTGEYGRGRLKAGLPPPRNEVLSDAIQRTLNKKGARFD